MSKTSKLPKLKIFIKIKLLVKSTFTRFFDNQGVLIANGLAFKTIIAIAPVVAILAWFLKVFPIFPSYKETLMDILKDYIVPDSFNMVVSFIDSIFEKSGTISIISIIIFLFLSIDLLVTLDNYVEKIWATNFKRSFPQKILKYWALLSATPFVLGGYFYYSGLIRSLLAVTPISTITNLHEVTYSIISFFLLNIFFFFAYFIIPSTKIHISKAILISSIVSIIWIVLRFGFSFYTKFMIKRWSIFYGSFAIFIIFVVWTAANWSVLLLGVEFLCVWQNKLYYESPRIREIFLFDVAFILLILDDFFIDFNNKGRGFSIADLANRYRYSQKDINLIISLLENEGFIVEDFNKPKRFFLKKNINKVKLIDIESLVWLRLTIINYRKIPRLQNFCEKLKNYYYRHPDQTTIYLREFFKKS